MVFNVRETVSRVVHWAVGSKRRMLKLPADRFFKSESAFVPALDKTTGQPRICHFCGYWLAEHVDSNGWRLVSCSATKREYLMKVQNLLQEREV